MRRDDSTLSPEQLSEIRQCADRLLRKANAYGRFPTPVEDLVQASGLEIEPEVSLESSFLEKLYRRLPGRVKHAVDKVLGVLDARAGLIYLDRSVHQRRRVFLSLHEIGHGFLPWQQQTWSYLEDSEATLDEGIRDQFEREANMFASDVLFQLDAFQNEARDSALGIGSVLKLARRYGSSFYAAVRRYVAVQQRACAVVIFDKPSGRAAARRRLALRRSVESPRFIQLFGSGYWRDSYGPQTIFGQSLPQEGRFTRPTVCRLRDRNGKSWECLVEAFDSSYQVFFLIYPIRE